MTSPCSASPPTAIPFGKRRCPAKRSAPTIDRHGQIYAGAGQFSRGRKSRGALVCLDGNSHKIRWERTAAGAVESTPAIGDDDVIYFGDNAGVIHAVDFLGNVLWTAEVGSPVRERRDDFGPRPRRLRPGQPDAGGPEMRPPPAWRPPAGRSSAARWGRAAAADASPILGSFSSNRIQCFRGRVANLVARIAQRIDQSRFGGLGGRSQTPQRPGGGAADVGVGVLQRGRQRRNGRRADPPQRLNRGATGWTVRGGDGLFQGRQRGRPDLSQGPGRGAADVGVGVAQRGNQGRNCFRFGSDLAQGDRRLSPRAAAGAKRFDQFVQGLPPPRDLPQGKRRRNADAAVRVAQPLFQRGNSRPGRDADVSQAPRPNCGGSRPARTRASASAAARRARRPAPCVPKPRPPRRRTYSCSSRFSKSLCNGATATSASALSEGVDRPPATRMSGSDSRLTNRPTESRCGTGPCWAGTTTAQAATRTEKNEAAASACRPQGRKFARARRRFDGASPAAADLRAPSGAIRNRSTCWVSPSPPTSV